ncbi:hypothetical protein CYY_003762 [Polysphondylium violaceum]|uniref:TehB/YeaR-like domain-containing protein n=1 Tax=Polysphondylium violaceum TaxID=133409 RepID=A0A8J4PXY6_9MYCE|nr:hypothetical protein CYY_003762 [Polysphondylium violaceum]
MNKFLSRMEKDLVCYKKMPLWSGRVPDGFKCKHNTKVGTWAKLEIYKGSLDFAFLTDKGEITEQFTFTKENQPPFIEPQKWHKIVSCSDDIECQLSFYHKEKAEPQQ